MTQESLFFYRLDGKIRQGFRSDVIDGKILWNISAFTVAELGQMLPFGYYSRHGKRGFTCGSLNAHTHGTYLAATEANARAAMLIYLLERKIIKPEDL